MEISSDYKDLFSILKKHKVKYLVVGAYAVMYYTEPRFTKDLDIWVKSDKENASKVYNALKEFGAPLINVSPKDFTKKEIIYQIGVAPIRVDIMTSLPNVRFDTAWKNRKKSRYGEIPINIIGLNELIRSKKKSNRRQDELDIEMLKRALT